MADQIRVDRAVVGDKIELTFRVEPGSNIPNPIFLHENTGLAQLGDFIGICNMSEMLSTQEFVGTPIPVFANKYVRYTSGSLYIPPGVDEDVVIQKALNGAKLLKVEYEEESEPTSTLYPI